MGNIHIIMNTCCHCCRNICQFFINLIGRNKTVFIQLKIKKHLLDILFKNRPFIYLNNTYVHSP